MAHFIADRLSQLNRGENNLLEPTSGLRAQLLRIRAYTYTAELDNVVHNDESAGTELGSGMEFCYTDNLLGDNSELGLSCHRPPKRKNVNDLLGEDFEADLRQLRARVTGAGSSYIGREYHELRTSIAQLREQYDNLDPDADESVVALHNMEMQAITDDYRYSRLRELGFSPTILDLEYGRASLLTLVMEPGGGELNVNVRDIGGRRQKVQKVRQPYTVSCALRKSYWVEMSFTWPDSEFRKFYRLSQFTFWEIVRQIENDEVFQSKGKKPQRMSGLPGSRPDTSVWSNSDLFRLHNKVFEPGEFLLADGGYSPSPFVLIPYNARERREGDRERKRLFNEKVSKARVVIEHTFVVEMGNLYRAIEALMVLHNMCYDLHDRADGFVDEFIQSRIDNNEEPYDYIEQGPDIAELDVNNGQEVFTGDLRQAGLFFRDCHKIAGWIG
ncbi:DDE superfamily endonuclease [Ceratobasidium sp. AG-Ba]|nr:DDE superfamily endonuclease [Ceratobasidium sp. AG-Ba]